METILASQSPRRQELLRRIVPEFTIMPASIDETIQPDYQPKEYVYAMAEGKAEVIAKTHPFARIIGCDTIVVQDQQILGKPANRMEAFKMLKSLSGTTHQVFTSVVVKQAGKTAALTSQAEVTFYPLTDAEIAAYLDTGEYTDKAGAYGIQGEGALLVKAIKGDFYTIVGFPLAATYRLLRDFEQIG